MSQVPATRTGFKFMLVVRKGPDKGATYQLLPPRVTIGRGGDNNIVLTDPRVSRNAAIIDFSMEKISITDASSRQALSVNGERTDNASIKNGDLIQIGESEFAFVVEALQIAPSGALAPLSPPRPPAGGGFHSPPPPRASEFGGFSQVRRSPVSMNKSSGKLQFYGIVGVVVGGLVWFLSQESGSKRLEKELRTVEVVERDLKQSEQRIEKLSKKRSFASVEDKTRYEEAQKHYLIGFRDYQDGQWLRAMRSLETAYTIDPSHQLAMRYYRLAEKQRDEMVALLTKEGLSYKDRNMFSRCSAAFDKVMDALSNREDVKYKQAKALKEECDLLEEDRFD